MLSLGEPGCNDDARGLSNVSGRTRAVLGTAGDVSHSSDASNGPRVELRGLEAKKVSMRWHNKHSSQRLGEITYALRHCDCVSEKETPFRVFKIVMERKEAMCLTARGPDNLSGSAQGGQHRIWRVGANSHPGINKLHAIRSLFISFH